jgi:hypothetical protein
VVGFLSDETAPLDGMVGSLDSPEGVAPLATGGEALLQVSLSGDVVSGPAAMGLAEDLRALVQGFVRDPESSAEAAERLRTAPAGPGAHVQFTAHGLELGPDAENALRRTVQAFVAERVTPGQEGK